jgi:hypothetical protein
VSTRDERPWREARTLERLVAYDILDDRIARGDEVSPSDPATFVAVAFVLSAAALAACCGPALNSARVDPLVAMRHE